MAGEKLLVLDPDDPGFNTVLCACSVTLETSLFILAYSIFSITKEMVLPTVGLLQGLAKATCK